MMSGCGGEDDLSSDAVPTTPDTRTKPTGNPPAEEKYSFMRQLRIRSPRKYNEYKEKIKLIMKYSMWFSKIEEFGDVLMVCSEEDNDAAGDYCSYLQTLRMGGGPLHVQPAVRVKASLMDDVVPPGQNVFTAPEKLLRRFTFIFLYVTGRSKNDNGLYSYYQQMCKYEEMKKKEKEGCLAVVYTADIKPDDIPSWLQGEMIISASDRSKDTKNALIKKLESKLYLREAIERKIIEKKLK